MRGPVARATVSCDRSWGRFLLCPFLLASTLLSYRRPSSTTGFLFHHLIMPSDSTTGIKLSLTFDHSQLLAFLFHHFVMPSDLVSMEPRLPQEIVDLIPRQIDDNPFL
jgi:hypothetical protein